MEYGPRPGGIPIAKVHFLTEKFYQALMYDIEALDRAIIVVYEDGFDITDETGHVEYRAKTLVEQEHPTKSEALQLWRGMMGENE